MRRETALPSGKRNVCSWVSSAGLAGSITHAMWKRSGCAAKNGETAMSPGIARTRTIDVLRLPVHGGADGGHRPQHLPWQVLWWILQLRRTRAVPSLQRVRQLKETGRKRQRMWRQPRLGCVFRACLLGRWISGKLWARFLCFAFGRCLWALTAETRRQRRSKRRLFFFEGEGGVIYSSLHEGKDSRIRQPSGHGKLRRRVARWPLAWRRVVRVGTERRLVRMVARLWSWLSGRAGGSWSPQPQYHSTWSPAKAGPRRLSAAGQRRPSARPLGWQARWEHAPKASPTLFRGNRWGGGRGAARSGAEHHAEQGRVPGRVRPARARAAREQRCSGGSAGGPADTEGIGSGTPGCSSASRGSRGNSMAETAKQWAGRIRVGGCASSSWYAWGTVSQERCASSDVAHQRGRLALCGGGAAGCGPCSGWAAVYKCGARDSLAHTRWWRGQAFQLKKREKKGSRFSVVICRRQKHKCDPYIYILVVGCRWNLSFSVKYSENNMFLCRFHVVIMSFEDRTIVM